MPAGPTGTYHLEVGDEVAYKILDASANLEKMMQVAPNGVVLCNSSTYYFKVPADVSTVKLRASRPGFRIFKPDSAVPGQRLYASQRDRPRPAGRWRVHLRYQRDGR